MKMTRPTPLTILSDNAVDDCSVVTNANHGITLKQDDDIIWLSELQVRALMDALETHYDEVTDLEYAPSLGWGMAFD